MSLRPPDVLPAIRTARARDFYLAYLNSPAWKTRRNRALQLADWRCQRCSGKRDLQVHHRTYDRLGREWDQDLEVVCAACHEAHHLEATAASPIGIYLKIAGDALRAQPFADVAELSAATKQLCATHHVRYDGPQIHRALELVTGRRFVRMPNRSREHESPSPAAITAQDAHKILRRLEVALGVSVIPQRMPASGPSPADQAAHEARLKAQTIAVHRASRQREPLRKRIDQMFETAPW